ncbi:MAG: protein translocase subunit SecD, partial [Dehalococcoidia bacterium]|nr:protein translocase subunit SecD [Dehalococcoidia bacterium]
MRPRSKDGLLDAKSRVTRGSFLRRILRKRPRISGNTWVLLFILALLSPAIWVLTPSGSIALDRIANVSEEQNLGMRLGLDLQGGSHLLYQADFQEDWSDSERAFHLDRAIYTIRDRIDKYGVTEPVIQQQGSDRILVQLPGITDIDKAKALIEETGFLEFREIERTEADAAVTLSDYLDDEDRTDFFDETVEGKRIFARIFPAEDGDEDIEVTLPYYLEKDEEGLRFVDSQGNPVDIDAKLEESDEAKRADKLVDNHGDPVDKETYLQTYAWMPAVGKVDNEDNVLTGAYLDEALPWFPPPESLQTDFKVIIKWSGDGTELFKQITNAFKGRADYGSPLMALGMFLDDEIISSPQLWPITMTEDEYGSEATITGDFTWDEVRLLAIHLDSGSLDMPLKKPPMYESEVSATLGKDFIDKAILAGGIGLGVIMLFMILCYRLPGVLASLSLLVYLVLVLAIFKAIPVTLTLAGLAGLILSIGMAVDANVLIFERLKEELRAGRTLKAAAETGFNRAWIAIRDSNISTFIICG